MSTLTALFTSDASLVRCELDRVRPALTLPGDYAGIGAWSDGVPLQRRFGSGGPRHDVWECPDTEVALVLSGSLPVGANFEDSAQPFRFHQWLFAAVSQVSEAERVRERLYDQLPEFLQQVVRGHQLDEVIFAHFLTALRALGRIDDPTIEAGVAAKALQAVAHEVEQASAASGATQKSRLALMASNGRVLVAARQGAQPLGFSLLEGQVECRRCELTEATKDQVARVRDHRRRRSVVLSTVQLGPHDVAVPDGGAVAVDRALQAIVLPA